MELHHIIFGRLQDGLHRGPCAVAKRIVQRAFGRAAGKAINELVAPER